MSLKSDILWSVSSRINSVEQKQVACLWIMLVWKATSSTLHKISVYCSFCIWIGFVFITGKSADEETSSYTLR